jgi:hypothetical protein
MGSIVALAKEVMSLRWNLISDIPHREETFRDLYR